MDALLRLRWSARRRLRRIRPGELRRPKQPVEVRPGRFKHAGAFVAASMKQRRSLVNELVDLILRYVVMTQEQALVCALWVIHTHCIERFEQTPYLAITSPEKRCGKSRLLEVLALVVARPWEAVLPSEAVVYRKIAKDMPTLLLDEVDAIFNPKTADKHEGLRALLNAGHRRGAKVARCLGPTGSMVEFSVFSPKVIAAIGALPDTVADRSIPVRLQRRTAAEPVERFYLRQARPETEGLVRRIHEWVGKYAAALADARPEMPEALNDRMQEGCECLVAIADAAGCGVGARAALVELLSGEREDDQETMRLRLLRDLRAIFAAKGNPTAITTSILLAALMEIPEAPWDSYYGKPITDRGLATLLHTYGVKSTTIRFKRDTRKPTTNVKPAKGYRFADLHPVWERYSARNGDGPE